MKKVSVTAYILICVLTLIYGPPPCFSQLADHSDEEKLDRQHDWVIFADIQDKLSLFKYKGSRLYPVTNVRLSLRPISNSRRKAIDLKTERYQDLWFHHGQVVGSRRYKPLDLTPNSVGTIIIRNLSEEQDSCQAAAGAVVQLSVDLFLRRILVSSVVIPQDRYNDFTESLATYGFTSSATEGLPQMSIHLRSKPYVRDQYFYWHSRY
ncbi:MAG: hypothetical protein K2Z81_02480 [Cyanobacteria bacterium]|nr:hypothetical protein [Cyanobacteriota bacterium]